MKSFILLLSYFQVSAFAECTSMNLTDPEHLKAVGKEQLIPHFSKPRDQDGIGWCGAYATSDAFSYSAGVAISALDVTMNQYADENKQGKLQDMKGISLLSATNVASSVGYCPESVIPSDQTSSSNLGGEALKMLMTAFQEITEDFKKKGKPKDYCVQCENDKFEKIIKPALPNVTSEMILDVLTKYKGDSLKSIRALMGSLCEGHRKKSDLRSQLIFTEGREVKKILDEALEKDTMPGIDINTKNFAKDEVVQGEHTLHEMLVVGRRKNESGKCEYLIRNSWGKGCSFYIPEVASTCDPSNGSFWMSEDKLQSGVEDVLIIDHPKNEKLTSTGKIENDFPITLTNPFKNIDFNGLLQKIVSGVTTAAAFIWKSLSNMFKY